MLKVGCSAYRVALKSRAVGAKCPSIRVDLLYEFQVELRLIGV